MTAAGTPYGRRIGSGLLTVGFLALAVSILAARGAPARGYELNIYASTPPVFWVGCGLALAIAFVAATIEVWPRQAVAYLLGGTSLLAVAALPLVRGYTYVGSADGLTHLGWARDLAAAEYGPIQLFYPTTHVGGLLFDLLSGVSLTRSLLVLVFAMVVVYVSFIALTAWELTNDRTTTAVAAASAFMLLPINNVSTHLHPHPISMAILFSPVVLYMIALNMSPSGVDRRTLTESLQELALFGIVAAGLVLLHPQMAFVLFVVLGTITVAQFIARRVRPLSAVARARSLGVPTLVLGGAFAVWTVGRPRFRTSRANFAENIGALLGGSAEVGGEVGSRGASLTALGAGLPELFVKLLLVSTLYVLLAGVLLYAVHTGRLFDLRDRMRAFVACIVVGMVPIGLITLVYLVANVGTQAFRYGGFVMVVATLLGAVALGHLFSTRIGVATVPTRAIATLVLVVGLVLSLAVLYPSPYMYKPNQHVTEAQLEGHASVFESTPESALIMGLRDGPERYADATYGRQSDPTRTGGLNGTEFGEGVAGSVTADSWYIVVSDADRAREVRAYDELRYSDDSFRQVSRASTTSRVMSNGDVNLYLVTEE